MALLAPVYSSISLETASKIIAGVFEARRKEQLLPMACVVVDSGGHVVAFQREDGCSNLRFEIALGKASGALGMGMSSRLIAERLKERVGFQAAAAAAADGRFVPAPGGVLILNQDGHAIAAVGVSGDASLKDEMCAVVACLAAGLKTEPATPHPAWREAAL